MDGDGVSKVERLGFLKVPPPEGLYCSRCGILIEVGTEDTADNIAPVFGLEFVLDGNVEVVKSLLNGADEPVEYPHLGIVAKAY